MYIYPEGVHTFTWASILVFFRVHVSLFLQALASASYPTEENSSPNDSSGYFLSQIHPPHHRFSSPPSYSLSTTYSLRSLVSYFDFTSHCYPQLPTSLVFLFLTTAYFNHPESSPQTVHNSSAVKSLWEMSACFWTSSSVSKPIQEMRNFVSFHAMCS